MGGLHRHWSDASPSQPHTHPCVAFLPSLAKCLETLTFESFEEAPDLGRTPPPATRPAGAPPEGRCQRNRRRSLHDRQLGAREVRSEGSFHPPDHRLPRILPVGADSAPRGRPASGAGGIWAVAGTVRCFGGGRPSDREPLRKRRAPGPSGTHPVARRPDRANPARRQKSLATVANAHARSVAGLEAPTLTYLPPGCACRRALGSYAARPGVRRGRRAGSIRADVSPSASASTRPTPGTTVL